MGDISDLELPALLEDDGNVEKAEACRKQLEDVSKSANALLSLSENLLLECKLAVWGSQFVFDWGLPTFSTDIALKLYG